MAGSGQTGRAALSLGRSVILNDLNPDYVDLCRERLEAWPDDLKGPKKGGEERAPEALPLLEAMKGESNAD
jgi:DNA modification methylase